MEDSADQEELGEHEEGNLEEEEVGIEGRAELRAPANTAGFQQRVERPERAPDRFRRGRRRPMRGRRNIQRESQPTISELLKELMEVIWVSPGTWPNCFSSGAVTVRLITSGLAPG